MTAAICILIAPLLCAPGVPRPIDDLLAAIRTVESHGKHMAVGDGGRAIGPYQIHHAYWKDSKVPGRWEQCHDRRFAERVVVAYWRRYCPKALANRDWKVLARVHNGGPRGHMKSKTFGYWQKVQSAIQPKKKASSICCSQ